MEIEESIYEGVVEPSYKKLLRQMPTMLVSPGKLGENTPRQLLTPRRVRALESSEKGMYIIRRIYCNYLVLSMAL